MNGMAELSLFFLKKLPAGLAFHKRLRDDKGTMKELLNLKPQKSAVFGDRVLFCTGLLLLCMELWKQLYLYFAVFGEHYQVWYLPWQLCSMPMYLCLLYGIHGAHPDQHRRKQKNAKTKMSPADDVRIPGRKEYARAEERKRIIATFLADYGFLGGVAALIVHTGFTFPAHPLLTLHGYLWHVILIFLALFITKNRLSDTKKTGFLKTLPLFAAAAAVAEGLNLLLHSFGDCDMFYISPYHLSSQPVFSDIDRLIGRIPGIFCYLACVILGAFFVHLLLGRLQRTLWLPKG